jgi:hypothetical protein
VATMCGFEVVRHSCMDLNPDTPGWPSTTWLTN